MNQTYTDLIEEYIQKLQDQGHTEDYINGALEGYIFAHQMIQSLVHLLENKNKYMMQEYQVDEHKINS